MKKNYLFIKQDKDIYDLSKFQFTDIHFWNLGKLINKKDSQCIYIYCKTNIELQNTINQGYIPHITFLGDSLFSDFYQNTLVKQFNNVERFWFPEKKHLSLEYIESFLALPEIAKTSIAIVFNPLFQEDISYSQFLDFIKILYSKYKSPLFEKDLLLQDEEVFSNDNKAIIDGKDYYVILGLFGDYYLSEEPTIQSLNLGILKDSQCVTCEYAQTCKDRGLGTIKYVEKINTCIGIKLFQHI